MICLIILAVTTVAYLLSKRFMPDLLVDLKRSHLMLILAVEVLGIVTYSFDAMSGNFGLTEMERPKAGQEGMSETLILRNEIDKKEIGINLSPRKPTAGESKKEIQRARAEIDKSLLGKNRSVDEIYRKLIFKESYCEGRVEASWNTDDTDIIDLNGNIHLIRVKKPKDITVTATLKCSDVTSEYDIDLKVIPPPEDTAYGFMFYLRQALRDADRSMPTSEIVKLPQKVAGQKIGWERKKNMRGAQLTGLGFLLALAMIIGGREERARREKKRRLALERDYPSLVGTLSLYVSAGIGVKAAFRRITRQFPVAAQEEEEHPGYAAVQRLCRQMEDGMGELEAYREFGRSVGHRDYAKLSMLLVQNLKKGSRMLSEKLEKEEASAFEQRKIRARIAGEEASTKLLIPMGMLLAVVLAVMVMPSIVNLKI